MSPKKQPKKIPIEMVPAASVDDPLFTSEQLCSYLEISTRTLKRLTAKKALNFIRLSAGAYRFRKSAVEAFLGRRTVQAKGVAA
jgi:excisionase family DNA binding protein